MLTTDSVGKKVLLDNGTTRLVLGYFIGDQGQPLFILPNDTYNADGTPAVNRDSSPIMEVLG